MEEEKSIEERKKKVKDFLFKRKNLLVIIGLIVLLVLAWHIRTANVPNLKDVTTNDYTLGPDLDPYLFLRYAEYIVENGKLMKIDYMRNVPLGWNTGGETKLLPYMIAYFHKFLSLFSDKGINYSAVIFPAFMFLLTSIAFFLFVREIFNDKKSKDLIALIATAFLIISPSLLPRTVAGIPEKESVSFLFMFLAFYFFLKAWRTEKIKNGILFASLAGVFSAGMGLVWGGVRYLFLIVGLAVFIEFILGKIDKKKILYYFSWIFFSFLILVIFFPARYSIGGMINASTSSGISFGTLVLILIHSLIFETRIKELKLIKRLKAKIPDKIISLAIFVVIGIIGIMVIFGYPTLHAFVRDFFFSLTRTGTDRLSFTVAENRQPYFNEWKSNFGPVIKDVALFFWLFFLGSIFLFYDSVKKLKIKDKWILTSSFIFLLFALIFSRYSSSSLMNGTSMTSKLFYFSGYLVITCSVFYLYFRYFKENNLDELKKINSYYLFLVAFFFVSLIGARSAIRLIMVLSVPASAIIGYFFVAVIEKIRGERDKKKITFVILAVIVILASLYSFIGNPIAILEGENRFMQQPGNFQIALASAKSMIPSSYTQQWQYAMKWVRENTPENAVFSHWWDYGYWLQSIGNRATVLDGGNAIDYWNHLLGRHVLTGQSEREALEFLYAHNATYLLIDSTEIGKYGAYSSIGSNEEYDRYSQIATFSEDESASRETKNETLHLYRGGMFLDEDYLLKIEGKEVLLPVNRAGIGGVIFTDTKLGEIKQPQVVVVYEGKQINIPLRYVYYQGEKYDFETGYEGALYMIPSLVYQEGKGFIKNSGTAFFLTERAMRALWVKLYLFNEGENFELVHNEDSFVVRDLKSQADIGDFVNFQGFQGPIKIWKINYPSDIEFKEEYLNKEYPESLRTAKQAFY